jgi:F-type H+-transporting ATPase subunit delta
MASVTSRYARAFADVVLAHKAQVADVRQELASLVAAMKTSGELRRVWENPSIPAVQKVRLLDALAGKLGLSREMRNFAAVLIDRRRIGQLETIGRQFEQDLNQRTGVAEAEITSAREIGSEDRRALEGQMERLTGKKISAHYSTNERLLGGAVVRVGSTIYDGSVLGQLQKIREQLSAD